MCFPQKRWIFSFSNTFFCLGSQCSSPSKTSTILPGLMGHESFPELSSASREAPRCCCCRCCSPYNADGTSSPCVRLVVGQTWSWQLWQVSFLYRSMCLLYFYKFLRASSTVSSPSPSTESLLFQSCFIHKNEKLSVVFSVLLAQKGKAPYLRSRQTRNFLSPLHKMFQWVLEPNRPLDQRKPGMLPASRLGSWWWF